MSITEHKHMSECAPARRVEIFTGAGRRRTWPAEVKAGIVAESYGAGETVSAVARRHGLTVQQLFAWRRAARRARDMAEAAGVSFVPVVSGDAPLPRAGAVIEIELAGAVVRVPPGAEPGMVRVVLRALRSGR